MDAKISFFLGANTPAGFYSLYDQMLPTGQERRIFLLKGGAGCGKSSLMRRVADTLEKAGERTEYIRCSGDPDSLDAVIFPDLGAAVADATAPHVLEPKLPGVVESYIDLGRFYDHAALAPQRGAIAAAVDSYQGCYRRAYRCLRAACELMEDDRALLSSPALEAKLLKRSKGILSREVKKSGRQPGRVRKRFLGAVSCQGVLCGFDTVQALCKRVYELRDSFGLAGGMLSALSAGCTAAGYDVIACPSPLAPERLEHLIVPGLGLGFITTAPNRAFPGHAYRRIRVDAMADSEVLRRYKARLKFSRKVAAAILDEGVEALSQAKAEHDALEKLYNPHVDFEGVYRQAGEVASQLLRLRDSFS